MYVLDDKVKCTESNLIGIVIDREWEGGWQYTIITADEKYFYRNDRELEFA